MKKQLQSVKTMYLYTLYIAYTVYIIHGISYILILKSFQKVYSNNFGYSLWVSFINKTRLNSKGQVLPIRSYTQVDTSDHLL